MSLPPCARARIISDADGLRPLTFTPVTRSNLEDFEAVFEGPYGPKFCWCMVFRATPEEGRGTKGPVRHAQMRHRIEQDIPVGLIGYLDDTPCTWVSIAPRHTYQRLNGPPERQGDIIWSLVCMFMPKRLRGQGRAHELIRAATTHAFANGANIVEAYPVAPDAPSYRFMGFTTAFEQAGFVHCGMAGKRRHVMRRTGG